MDTKQPGDVVRDVKCATCKFSASRWTPHLAVVVLLSLVSENGANDDASILDNHLPCIDVPLAEQTSAVDSRPMGNTEEVRSSGICNGLDIHICSYTKHMWRLHAGLIFL